MSHNDITAPDERGLEEAAACYGTEDTQETVEALASELFGLGY